MYDVCVLSSHIFPTPVHTKNLTFSVCRRARTRRGHGHTGEGRPTHQQNSLLFSISFYCGARAWSVCVCACVVIPFIFSGRQSSQSLTFSVNMPASGGVMVTQEEGRSTHQHNYFIFPDFHLSTAVPVPGVCVRVAFVFDAHISFINTAESSPWSQTWHLSC